jgi:hypothetical protein
MGAFVEHLRRAGPDGAVVFYYSGHGVRLPGNYGMGPPVDPETDGRDEALLLGDGTLLLDDEIGALADRLSADRILIVLDSCFSGTGSRGSGWSRGVSWAKAREFAVLPEDIEKTAPPAVAASMTSPDEIQDILRDPGRHVLLAASGENEEARSMIGLRGATDTTPSGVFTWFLVDALEKATAETTFDEALADVQRRTRDFLENAGGGDQQPAVAGQAAGTSVRKFLSAGGARH